MMVYTQLAPLERDGHHFALKHKIKKGEQGGRDFSTSTPFHRRNVSKSCISAL